MTAFDTEEDKLLTLVPDHEVNARETFGVDFDFKAPAFKERDPHVPDFDANYKFDPETTRALLAGFTVSCERADLTLSLRALNKCR